MMWEVPSIWVAWLILYLIANSSASVDVMLIVWWRVFFKELLNKWTWVISMAILFLMLASETMTTVDGLDDGLSTILLRQLQWWDLLSSKLQSALWKEKWLEKELTNLFPGWNSLLRELNNGNIPLRQLLASTMKLLMAACCLDAICSKEKQCCGDRGENLFSNNSFNVWL